MADHFLIHTKQRSKDAGCPAYTQFYYSPLQHNSQFPFSLLSFVQHSFIHSFTPSVKNSCSCWSAQGSCSVQHGGGNATCTKRSTQFPPQSKLEGDGHVLQGAICEKKSRRGGWMSLRFKPAISDGKYDKNICRKDHVHVTSSNY